MDNKSSLSSFLVDLLLVGVVGNVDAEDVSIVYDASRLPSESLVNKNRRAMGMEDFYAPTFLKKQTNEKKKNRWEGLLECTRRSNPTQVVRDPASSMKPARRPGLGSRASSESKLLRPSRSPSSPDSSKQPRTSEGPGGRNESRNIHRWASSSMSCVTIRSDPASTATPARRPGLGSRQCSDSMLLRPRRRPSSPDSPTHLLTNEGLGGKTSTRDKHRWKSSSTSCINEEVTSPQANAGATASKLIMTHEDRHTLLPPLWNSMLSPKMEEIRTSDVDEEDSVWSWRAESGLKEEKNKSGRYSLLQKQRSESTLVKNVDRRGVRRLLPFQPTAIEELEEDLVSLMSIESRVAESPSISTQCFGDSTSSSITERDLMSIPTTSAAVEDNDDIDEGSLRSLRTMVLEADGIDNEEDDESEAGSLWIEDLEMHCGCPPLFEGNFSMPSTKSKSSEDETSPGDQTKFFARANDSMLLHYDAEAEGSREKNLRARRQSRTTPSQTANGPSPSTAPLVEGDFSMPLTKNMSFEDEMSPGNQTKFFARANDSMLLLHDAEAVRTRELNLRAERQSRETRKVYSDGLHLQRGAEGLGGGISDEQIRGDISDSTLISLYPDALMTRKQNPTTSTLVVAIADPPGMRHNNGQVKLPGPFDH
jgi:hypothetical protein